MAVNCDKHSSNAHYWDLDLYFLVPPNGENIFDYLLLYFYINRLVLKRKASNIFTSGGADKPGTTYSIAPSEPSRILPLKLSHSITVFPLLFVFSKFFIQGGGNP